MRAHREAPNNPRVAIHNSRLLLYKYPTPVSPLECAVPRFPTTVHSKRLTRSAKSFRMRTYEKTGGRGPLPFLPSQPPFTPKGTCWPSPVARHLPLGTVFCFQRVTSCPICKSFVLKTFQQWGRYGGGSRGAGVKVLLELNTWARLPLLTANCCLLTLLPVQRSPVANSPAALAPLPPFA